jgi:hypothetical protein
MSHIYQGEDPLPTPPIIGGQGEFPDIQIPDDGDDRDAQSAGVGLEGLTDRSVWLQRRMVNGLEGGIYNGPLVFGNIAATNEYKYIPRFYTRVITEPPSSRTTTWVQDSNFSLWKTSNNLANDLTQYFGVPDGVTVTNIKVYFKGGSGHTNGNPPSSLPILLVGKVNVTTGVLTTFGTVSDTFTTASSYQTTHPITFTFSTGELVDKSLFRYVVFIFGEGGTNALSDATYFGATITYIANAVSIG